MKKIFITLVVFTIGIHQIFAQSYFENTDLVDEFGDKIGEVKRNISIGTFSNSATNNSPLRVNTILEVMPDYTLEEWKEYLTKTYKDSGLNEKDIKRFLKYAESSLKMTKNINGTLKFDLYEYKDNKASVIGVKTGIISIKTFDGTKIKALLHEPSFSTGSVTIGGYKELTSGATGVKNQVKYRLYDWSQTEIYNKIISEQEPIKVVISFGNSTYKFTLE